jgi:hypothetical protein
MARMSFSYVLCRNVNASYKNTFHFRLIKFQICLQYLLTTNKVSEQFFPTQEKEEQQTAKT